MKRSILLAVLTAQTFGAGLATAEELRLGMAPSVLTPWGAAAEKFAADVSKLSGGDLTVSVYFNNELGDEQTMARQAARGRLDMAFLSNVAASLLVPEYGLLLSPYAFDTLEQADCVTDTNLSAIFGEAFDTAGAVFLAPIEVGQMVIMSKTPIHTPDDLADLKIRTSPTQTDTFFIDATGGAAVPLGTVDSMPAIKTGAVDALTTPVVMGVAGGYATEAPLVTRTDHGHQIGALIISQRAWDRLTEAHRAVLAEAAEELAALRPEVRAAEEALLEQVVAAGGVVHEPTADEMAAWKAVAADAMEAILAETGGDADDVWAAIGSAKQACAG